MKSGNLGTRWLPADFFFGNHLKFYHPSDTPDVNNAQQPPISLSPCTLNALMLLVLLQLGRFSRPALLARFHSKHFEFILNPNGQRKFFVALFFVHEFFVIASYLVY